MLNLKPQQFVCKNCGEICTSSSYVPASQKYRVVDEELTGIMTCNPCKQELRRDINSAGSTAQSFESRLRNKAEKKLAQADQEAWKKFKANYKALDLNILREAMYIPENSIPEEYRGISPEQAKKLIHEKMTQINALRSELYHQERKALFLQRERNAEEVSRTKQEKIQARREKDRADYLKSFKNSQRKIYYRLKMTPAEALAFLQEAGIEIKG
jgi:hypothetical protein